MHILVAPPDRLMIDYLAAIAHRGRQLVRDADTQPHQEFIPWVLSRSLSVLFQRFSMVTVMNAQALI